MDSSSPTSTNNYAPSAVRCIWLECSFLHSHWCNCVERTEGPNEGHIDASGEKRNLHPNRRSISQSERDQRGSTAQRTPKFRISRVSGLFTTSKPSDSLNPPSHL